MPSSSLSQPALKMIDAYEHLPFEHAAVVCPYFINRRQRVRGALRALVGKGNPDDIVEEAMILALKEKVDLRSLDAENVKKFLVDHKLGVDCSGFVYYVLDAELRAQNKGPLKKCIRFPQAKNPLRKLIATLRPAENTDVAVFADHANSVRIEPARTHAGDLIIFRGAGPERDRDHVLLVSAVDDTTIHYVHSFQWSRDGKYGHGIKRGKIEMTDPQKSLLDAQWLEADKTTEENETYCYAKSARTLEIRRLNILN